MAIAGEAINDKTARVTAGDKVENQGDEGEYGEEGAEVAVAHHHVKPHLLCVSTREPRQAPVGCCHTPPVGLVQGLHLGKRRKMLITDKLIKQPSTSACQDW